ncbi:hypothetical protein N0V87_005440 [Didymella glomerata]|uniref:Uncharacterized protein n=1 Tax=Didymella glomerata TaxID=749621 RepID=A0A9W8WZH8_9PLEO|nr:hypothetical protein N0V87_005440 [Didymella glomerata]
MLSTAASAMQETTVCKPDENTKPEDNAKPYWSKDWGVSLALTQTCHEVREEVLPLYKASLQLAVYLPGDDESLQFCMSINRPGIVENIMVVLHVPDQGKTENVDIYELIVWARAMKNVRVRFLIDYDCMHPNDEDGLPAFLDTLVQNKSLPALDRHLQNAVETVTLECSVTGSVLVWFRIRPACAEPWMKELEDDDEETACINAWGSSMGLDVSEAWNLIYIICNDSYLSYRKLLEDDE